MIILMGTSDILPFNLENQLKIIWIVKNIAYLDSQFFRQMQNRAFQRREIQVSGNKQAHVHSIIPKASQANVYRRNNACEIHEWNEPSHFSVSYTSIRSKVQHTRNKRLH